jgi:hypothetical protein
MKYRVVVWSTGTQGLGFLREVILNPQFELAGVLVYSAEKDDMDAGDIVGLPKTGIKATRNPEAIYALDADVVLHSPKGHHRDPAIDDQVIRLLESGKSVISTRGYYWPWYYNDDYADRLIAACRKGRSSLMGWGPNPGWVTDSFAATVAQAQLRLDHITVTEAYDCTPLHEDMLKKMGFGLDRAQYSATPINANYDELYIPNLMSLVEQLGRSVERVESQHDAFYAKSAIDGLTVPVPEGGMQGTRRRWTAIVNGKPFATVEYLWFVGKIDGWPDRNGWHVTTKGLPNLKSTLHFDNPTADHTLDDMFVDMMVAISVRSIPALLAATPGIFKVPVFASQVPK